MFERRPAENSRERIATAREQLTQLRKDFQAELAAAASFHSEDYTSVGLENRRRELADQVRASYLPKVDELKAQVKWDSEMVAGWARKVAPRLGDDALSLQRAQAKWDSVRTRLDAGMPLGEILQSADLDIVLAIQEWAPAWQEARAYASRVPGQPVALPSPDALVSAITARLKDIAPADVQWAIEAQEEASVAAAGFAPMADHVEALARGDRPAMSGLEAATAARFAEQGAQATADALEADGGDAGDGDGDAA